MAYRSPLKKFGLKVCRITNDEAQPLIHIAHKLIAGNSTREERKRFAVKAFLKTLKFHLTNWSVNVNRLNPEQVISRFIDGPRNSRSRSNSLSQSEEKKNVPRLRSRSVIDLCSPSSQSRSVVVAARSPPRHEEKKRRPRSRSVVVVARSPPRHEEKKRRPRSRSNSSMSAEAKNRERKTVQLNDEQRRELARIMWGFDPDKNEDLVRLEQFPSTIQIPAPFRKVESASKLKRRREPFCGINMRQMVKILNFLNDEDTEQSLARVKRMTSTHVFPLDSNLFCQELKRFIKKSFPGFRWLDHNLEISNVLGAGSYGMTVSVIEIKNNDHSSIFIPKDALKIFHDGPGTWMAMTTEYEIAKLMMNRDPVLVPRIKKFSIFPNARTRTNTGFLFMESLQMTLKQYLVRVGELPNGHHQKNGIYQLIWEALKMVLTRLRRINVTHGDLHYGNLMLRPVRNSPSHSSDPERVYLPFIVNRHVFVDQNKYDLLELVVIDFGQSVVDGNFLMVDVLQFLRVFLMDAMDRFFPWKVYNFFLQRFTTWLKETFDLTRYNMKDYDDVDNLQKHVRDQYDYGDKIQDMDDYMEHINA